MTRVSSAAASAVPDPGGADERPGIGEHDPLLNGPRGERTAPGLPDGGTAPGEPIERRIAAVESEVAALRLGAAQNDQEIDALQIRAARQERPWHRSPEGLVPVLALVFSVLTALISGAWARSQHDVAERRLELQEVQDAESELRLTLRRLTELPKENALLYEQLSDPAVAGDMASFSNTENLMLLDQAVDLMERVERGGRRVSATQYATVAWFMNMWAGNHLEAERLYRRGIDAADASKDLMAYVGATRGYAQLLFGLERIEDGRRQYRDALGVHDRFRAHRPRIDWYANWIDGATELQWAQSELGAGNCAEAREHIRKADEHFDRSGPSGDGYRPALQATQQRIGECDPA